MGQLPRRRCPSSTQVWKSFSCDPEVSFLPDHKYTRNLARRWVSDYSTTTTETSRPRLSGVVADHFVTKTLTATRLLGLKDKFGQRPPCQPLWRPSSRRHRVFQRFVWCAQVVFAAATATAAAAAISRNFSRRSCSGEPCLTRRNRRSRHQVLVWCEYRHWVL